MVKVIDKLAPRSDPQEVADHLLWVLAMERTINLAVRKAQEENRRLGIPNYYEINGRIVSDQPEQQLEPDSWRAKEDRSQLGFGT